MSRKLLAPLAVVVTFALAACGSPPADNTTAPPADAAPATEPATPPPAS